MAISNQTGDLFTKKGTTEVHSESLRPLQTPLSRLQAAHFLRRTSFYGTTADVALLAGRPAADVVNETVDVAMNMDTPLPPPWVNDYPPGRDALSRHPPLLIRSLVLAP